MTTKKIIQTLVTELTTDGAKSKEGMEKNLKDAKTWSEKFKAITSGVAIGIGVGAVGLGTGVAALTKNAINTADAMSKQSQSVGMAIETLSAYSYAAEMGGVENEKFVSSLAKFNRVTDDAFKGVGSGVDAYDALGISILDSSGKLKTNAELFAEVADQFQRMPDGIEKTALATDLFGRSGADLIPVLNGGKESLAEMTAEAERLGLVISEDTGKRAELFNDNLEKMQKAVTGLGLRIAEDALPALNDLTGTINDPKTQEGLANLASGFVTLTSKVIAATAEIGNFSSWLGEALARDIEGIDIGNLQDVEEEIEDIRRALESPIKSTFDPTIPTRFLWTTREEMELELQKLIKARDDLNKILYEKPPTVSGVAQKPEPSAKPEVYDEFLDGDGALNYDDWQKGEDEHRNALLKKYQEENDLLFDAALKKENKEREALERQQDAANREVEMQRDKFSRIHQEMLSAKNLETELENYQHELDKKELEDELNNLREKGVLTAELEAEFRLADEEQEIAHQARLQEIKKRAEDEERARKEQGYAELIGMAETYNNAKGNFANRYTAVALNALKILSSKEKRESINKVARDGWKSISAAWASASFPYNAGPVAMATAAAAGNLAGVSGIAHGGMENVPKESTYMLDKGERVLSPNQNKDLTNFLKEPDYNLIQKPGLNVHIYNYGSSKSFSVEQLSETEVRVIARDEAAKEVRKTTPDIVASEISEPNSKISKSLSNNTTTQRRRS
jgi:hypothetical protein